MDDTAADRRACVYSSEGENIASEDLEGSELTSLVITGI